MKLLNISCGKKMEINIDYVGKWGV
jgi:hypothetical protein